jgi:hypothetical protein
MSKKDKSKFRKKLKAQLISQIQTSQTTENKIEIGKEATDQITSKPTPLEINQNPANQETGISQVKNDLKKTGLIVLGIAIVIGATFFLDAKYSILSKLGNWIFETLNIK